MTENLSATGIAPETADAVEVEEPIRIEMDKRIDLAISLALIAIGVVIIHLTNGFRLGSFPDPVTSRGLPYFTGTYLILAGLFLSARRIWTWSVIPGNFTVSEGHEDEQGHPSSAFRSFAIMALCAIWATLLYPLGFLVITPIIIACVLWLLEVRSIKRIAAFALIFTFVMWLAFGRMLGIPLPYGPFTALARSWGLIY